MKVKVKKLSENAVIPSYAKEGDAGLDLVATSKSTDRDGNIVYGTGLAFEIPKGYVGLLFPRSSNAKTNLILTDSVGVIDSGYRGEVTFKFKCLHYRIINYLSWWWHKYVLKKEIQNAEIHMFFHNPYEVGNRIGQLVIVKHPYIELVESEELSETERGKGGYGSTGD